MCPPWGTVSPGPRLPPSPSCLQFVGAPKGHVRILQTPGGPWKSQPGHLAASLRNEHEHTPTPRLQSLLPAWCCLRWLASYCCGPGLLHPSPIPPAPHRRQAPSGRYGPGSCDNSEMPSVRLGETSQTFHNQPQRGFTTNAIREVAKRSSQGTRCVHETV